MSAMNSSAGQSSWSVSGLVALFDTPAPQEGDTWAAETGVAGADERQVVEGTQVMGQAIVAVTKRLAGKAVRSVQAVFGRVIVVGPPIELEVDVLSEGRSTATVAVTVRQNKRRCMSMIILADVPSPDVIRHQQSKPEVSGPTAANPAHMPVVGAELKLVDVEDLNSPDEVGPPELHAWLRCTPIPTREDTAKALIGYFAGWFGIATTMRAHPGIGTAQAHHTVSTAPMTATIAFHEPLDWGGWLLYTHESTQVGAGMSYVRGTIHTEDGQLLASFTQESLIRSLRTSDTGIAAIARL
jgi:acyl-CoA thioesterase